jgi:long-chain acyl-CoA synthetase
MSSQVNSPAAISPASAITLDGLFRCRVSLTPDRPAYRHYVQGTGQWQQVTWAQMAQFVARWRAALQAEQLPPGERVALMLPNGCEWVQFEQAALSLGLVVVPLYVNDRPDNIAYILRETQARVLLLSGDEEQWTALTAALKSITELQRIVTLRQVEHTDTRLSTLRDWLPEAVSELHHRDAGADDLATIVYTSGTIGRPKGVMLSHRNILWNAWAGQRCVSDLGSDDLFLSFLPLSHMLERTAGYYIPMLVGAEVAFARSIPQLADDLMLIRPTVLISVPRIYERIFTRIQAQLEGRPAIARKLLGMTVTSGWRRFQCRQGLAGWSPHQLLWPLLKRRVADKVMDRLGGRIRIAICGGAPLAENISRFFIGLGLPLLQGYGMTETAPVLNANRPWNNDPASVGPALEDVEEMLSPDGELLARGPGNMLGYWRNEQATREVIDADGWLHTGDIARIENDRVYITGRLKDIIVMSNGEKVPPADMELAIALDPLIDQVMVIGEGRPYLTALLVLSEDVGSAGRRPDVDMLCQRIARQLHDFPGYAQIRRVAVIDEAWTVDEGLLTPTLKLRRNRILECYRDDIDRLYAGH